MIKTAATEEGATPGMYRIGRLPSCTEAEEYGGRGATCARVLLTVSAKDLRDLDPDESIDPYCVVSICDAASMARTRVWEEIGRTETISNTAQPEWSTKICLTYYFEEQQRLQFEVFDKVGAHKQRLGVASVLLHEIVGAHYNRLTKTLYEEGKAYGQLTVTAEELSEGRQESIYFVVSATNLDRKDFLGKCDPFLKISRINMDNTLQLAYRSRYHEQNLNPHWDQDGNHDLVGACRTTVNRLLTGLDKELPLINEKKLRKKQKYDNSGVLHFHKVYEWMDYTFLDFISGGTELDFTVAVDFTKSNLPIDDSSSLHRWDAYHANQYEIAINAIAEICQHYSRTKIFNAYGFGAKIPPDYTKVHYNFPLNLETNDPRCYVKSGVERSHRLYPTVRYAARRAAAMPEDGSKYCVLLIITDGAITDLENTKEEVVKASNLPLSIIIIGVGYDTFDEMKVLDADESTLSSHGKYARRDIVQFVQMRKFLPPHRSLSDEEKAHAKAKLAKEVLYEVPGQLVSYMKSRGIYPDPLMTLLLCRQERQCQGRHSAADRPTGSFKVRGSSPMVPAQGLIRKGSSPQQNPPRERRLLPTPPELEKLARTHFFDDN
uniref:C2 domain-containing protein n=1 Tax=Ditylenchus dipsaci TaxID=166011 RepID=A0A915CQ53_9BILA